MLSKRKICKICELEFITIAKGYSRKYCTNCLPTIGLTPSKRKTVLRQSFKKKLLELNGNKCCRCGYNKCSEALEFHHLNPKEKDFTISAYNSSNWEDYLKESKKCILVCSNCHKEIHNNIRPI